MKITNILKNSIMSFTVKLTAGTSVSAFLKLFLVPEGVGSACDRNRGADHMNWIHLRSSRTR